MKTSFQSGDIQRLLHAQKQRVEYLALKIPIRPEVEQVLGTGKAHLYSFRNALQFAVAQEVSNLGLYLTEIRSILETVQKLSDNDPGENVGLPLAASRFAKLGRQKFVKAVLSGTTELKGFFSEDATPRKVYLVLTTEAKSQQKSNEDKDPSLNRPWFPVSNLRDAMGTSRDAFGMVVLNLGKIRERVVTFADQEE